MTAEQWQQVKSLLEQTLEQPADDRVDWLERNCPDPETRDEVWSLVLAHIEIEDFLEQPSPTATELVAALKPESLVGERIGPWKLVEEIGRGGMGTVYRACRADDEFQREVAIKIVGRGLDAEILLRRFRIERQILANLEHPYIARLIDGGSTPTGLPYFVMEYVQGIPLTEYCDKHRLDVPQRIDLFRKVCSAVAYAHHNLIVHRDLKPANILVTADGTPKLLDFGIARLMSGPGREASEPTVTMLRMATPAYASPEQIRGAVAGIPSDIYSLGVLLYELLTGHRPYRLPTQDAGELARVICEREPTRPSLVVSFTESLERSNGDMTIVDPARICDDRNTSLDDLRRRLRGDIDNILSMALRKEPHRRYESVEQFAEDLQRNAAGLPILARRDTVGYRTGKFIERHRVGVMAGVVVALLLCITTVVALQKATRLSHRIEEDQRLATSFLVEIHDNIARLPGSTPAREALLNQSLKYLNGLSRDAGDEPGFQRSLAMAWERFAELQVGMIGPGLGRSADALETCKKAQEVREDLARRFPDDMQIQYELANNYVLAGYIAGRTGSAQIRRSFDTKALAIAERLVQADPRNAKYRTVLGGAHRSLAYGLLFSDDWEGARKHLRQALAIHTEIAAEKPSDLNAQRELAQIHYRLGASFVESGQPAHAREHLKQALALQYRISAGDPDNSTYKSDIAASHHFMGIALGDLAQHEDAVKHFNEAIAIRRAALHGDPRDVRSKYMLAGTMSKRSAVQLRANQLTEALQSAIAGVDLHTESLEIDPTGVPARISMAEYEARLGAIYEALESKNKTGAHARDALKWYRRAAERYAKLEGEGNLPSPALRAEAARSKANVQRLETALMARVHQ